MIDRLLDGLLPTRQQPAPTPGSETDRRVLLDRGVAAVLDVFLSYVFLVIPFVYGVSEVFPERFEALGGAAIVGSLLLLLPVYVTYSFAFEWRYGRTPGKVNRGLLVVMADGRRCTLHACAVRNLLRYVDLVGVPPVVVGLIAALVAEGRRIGDVAAGTVVVRARAPDDLDQAARADVDASAAARAGDAEERA